MKSSRRVSRRTTIASFLLLTILAWNADAIGAQLNLSWVDGSSTELGFSVDRSTGTTGTYAEIATTSAGILAFTDTTITDGTTYCYRVRAFNATAYSGYSNLACGATAQAYGLAVIKMGAGSGTVISSPSGIICGASCSASLPYGTAVTLTATPATGSTFAGWSSGGCSGTGTCAVTLTATTTVTAAFDVPQQQPVTLSLGNAGTGSGTVTSIPSGITCGTNGTICSASFPYGTAVTLMAAPGTGSTFAGWSGCTGTDTCTMALTSASAVTATFNLSPSQSATLTVSLSGPSGKGMVTSDQAGINCGTICSANYPSGKPVTLTAAAVNNFVFNGWAGGGCQGTGTCTVTMATATAVTATFANENKK